MNVQFDWIFLISASICTVGVMEYVKGFFVSKNIPKNVWRGVLALAAIVVALFAGSNNIGWHQVATNAIALVALCEMAYPLIVQLPAEAITFFRAKVFTVPEKKG